MRRKCVSSYSEPCEQSASLPSSRRYSLHYSLGTLSNRLEGPGGEEDGWTGLPIAQQSLRL